MQLLCRWRKCLRRETEDFFEQRQATLDNLFVPSNNPKAVCVVPGRHVLVYAKALQDDWSLYDKRDPPSLRKLATTLSSLSSRDAAITLRLGSRNNKRSFWEISAEVLEEHIRRAYGEEATTILRKMDVYYDVDILNDEYQPTPEDEAKRESAIKFLTNLTTADDADEEAAE